MTEGPSPAHGPALNVRQVAAQHPTGREQPTQWRGALLELGRGEGFAENGDICCEVSETCVCELGRHLFQSNRVGWQVDHERLDVGRSDGRGGVEGAGGGGREEDGEQQGNC